MDLTVLQSFVKEALGLGAGSGIAGGLATGVAMSGAGAASAGEGNRRRGVQRGGLGGAGGALAGGALGGVRGAVAGGVLGSVAGGISARLSGKKAKLGTPPTAPPPRTDMNKVSSLVLGKEVRPDMESLPKVKGLKTPRAFTPRLGAKKLPGGSPANPFSGNKVKLQKEGASPELVLGTLGVGAGAGVGAAGLLRSRRSVKHRYDRPNERRLPPQLELARDAYRELNSRSA